METTFSSSGNCGDTWGEMHEHGEWEVTSGGQAKVFRLVGIRGLGLEKGRKLECVGCGM
jgi:hypothetical protein